MADSTIIAPISPGNGGRRVLLGSCFEIDNVEHLWPEKQSHAIPIIYQIRESIGKS